MGLMTRNSTISAINMVCRDLNTLASFSVEADSRYCGEQTREASPLCCCGDLANHRFLASVEAVPIKPGVNGKDAEDKVE